MASSNRYHNRKKVNKWGDFSALNVGKRMFASLFGCVIVALVQPLIDPEEGAARRAKIKAVSGSLLMLIWPFFLLAYVTFPFWYGPLEDYFYERLAFGLFSIFYVSVAFVIALISVVVWIFDKLSASIMMFLACNGMVILIPIMGWLERYLGG
jgi:uncharacterized membrane protein